MTPHIELAIQEHAIRCQKILDYWEGKYTTAQKAEIIESTIKLATKDITAHTQSLKTRLAYAEDALSKNDLARQNAGGMEMRIGELEEENKKLLNRIVLVQQAVSMGSDGRLEIADEEKFVKAFAPVAPEINLQEENKRLREALEKAIRILKAEFGDVNWRIKDINNALTKP